MMIVYSNKHVELDGRYVGAIDRDTYDMRIGCYANGFRTSFKPTVLDPRGYPTLTDKTSWIKIDPPLHVGSAASWSINPDFEAEVRRICDRIAVKTPKTKYHTGDANRGWGNEKPHEDHPNFEIKTNHRTLKAACKKAKSADRWNAEGAPEYTLVVASEKGVVRALNDCEFRKLLWYRG